jgi:hypothetical protein
VGRTAGIQSALCFIIGYVVYGQQPRIGTTADGKQKAVSFLAVCP